MEEYSAYVGLDVHKDTIAVAVAYPVREGAAVRGFVPNTKRSLMKLVGRLDRNGERLLFCYEAGPCGYEVYRLIRGWGHDCEVVAPSKTPRKPGERVKTDRRDAKKLAELLRSGDLTAVWVPDKEQEAIRDLTRAREEMKRVELCRSNNAWQPFFCVIPRGTRRARGNGRKDTTDGWPMFEWNFRFSKLCWRSTGMQ